MSLSPSVGRELQAAPAKAAMAEALSIDMDEMKAISPETELEHSHATGMIIDLNDVVQHRDGRGARLDVSCGVSHLRPDRHVS